NEREIEPKLGGMIANEPEQMFRAALLLALEHERDRQRQAAGHCLPRAAGLDEGHELAFVVAGPARDDGLAALTDVLDPRLERRGLPQIQRIDRLHVVMTIEQRARPASVATLADDDRVAGGRSDVDVETERAEILGEMLGGLAALVPVGRIGRDRADAQQP